MKESTKQDQDSAESALRFRTLFEHAPFSVQLLSADGRTLQVNKAWETLWLAEGDNRLKDYVLREYNVLDDPQLEAKGVAPSMRRAFAGEPAELPAILYDPTELGLRGKPRWVSGRALPLKDGDGKVLEVILIHEDVSERLERETVLRESERRLQLLANTIPQLVWIAEPDGTITWYNDRWYEYTGMPRDADADWRRTHVHHPDTLDAVLKDWNRALRSGETFQVTSPMRGKDGEYRTFYTLMAPLKDEEGKVLQWFGTNTDVSALQETQDELRRALEALRESDRRKDEFLAMLAHELRNPLAPISTAAQLLALSGRDPKRVKQAGDIITRQVQHMVELVDDLLDVSRVTRGLVQLEKEPLDLKSVIAGALEQVRPLMEERGHTLKTWTDPGRLPVYGDRTRLVQVIVNLLNNAAKYTRAGGLIELRTEVAGEWILITVADNGQGIEPDFIPHVFELFTQAMRTPDRSQGGLGIGLALVKSIAALHGGDVEARSEGVGKGSTFLLRLPLRNEGGRKVVAAAKPAGGVASGPLDILIVDDNLDAAHSLASLLQLQGHRTNVQADAGGALAYTEGHAPQVLILDIGLPDMDGFTLAAELRRRPALADALFIALTGYGQPQDRARSKAAGFDHHFVKPADLRQLAAALGARAPRDG